MAYIISGFLGTNYCSNGSLRPSRGPQDRESAVRLREVLSRSLGAIALQTVHSRRQRSDLARIRWMLFCILITARNSRLPNCASDARMLGSTSRSSTIELQNQALPLQSITRNIIYIFTRSRLRQTERYRYICGAQVVRLLSFSFDRASVQNRSIHKVEALPDVLA